MRKRIIAYLITAALLTGLVPAAFAASQDQASRTLAALDVMVGDENGDLMLSRTVTRAEFTKMIVAMSSYKDNVGAETLVSPYPDVKYTNWAAPYVEAAAQAGYVRGYLDGTFRPGGTITLAEGVTMALRLLGYTDSDFTGVFPSGQMALYRALGLDDGVSVTSNTAALSRSDAMYLLYNLLTARTKAGSVYLVTLGHALTSSGEIDLVSLVNEAMEGPAVADSNWQTRIPFALGSATVYRSGALSSVSAVQAGDVLYWSKSMRTVWAYTSRATGTYQSASPSLSAPTAVTVAGKAYAIETSEAAFDLSNLGGFRTGDTVTLLLGRSGGVAAVVRAGQISSVVYGAVSSLGTASYTDSSGNAYTASAVTLTATDGSEYTFRTSLTSLKPGDLVQVTSSSSGETVTRLSEKALTGKMSSDGAKLGAYVLAGDAEILDTAGNLALRVYPARLAGISFTSGMVRYYVLNSAGQVSRLILDDVTGDLYSYGVITSASEISSGTTTVGSYVYDIGGMTGSYASSSSSLGVSAGPCRFVLSGGTLSSATNLKSVRLTGLDGNIGLAGSASYTLADDVAVYEVQRGDYYLSSLDRVGSGFSLTGWYDKAESSGGRVRVILAMASAD